MEFPTALLGVALGVVLLPQLAAAQAREDRQAYSDMLDWGLRLVVLLALPCAAGAARPSGRRWSRCCSTTAASPPPTSRRRSRRCAATASGLLGLVAIKVLAPAYFARQDIAHAGAHRDRRAGGHAGDERRPRALARTCRPGAVDRAGGADQRRSAAARPAASWRLPAGPGWGAFGARLLLGNVAVGAALAWAARAIDWIGLRAHWGERAAALALVLAGVALLYFGVLAVCGLRPRDLMRRA